ncbi:MAG: GNAT family N-acetyltransferase [Methanobacterium sp.]|nr:GNAT family N-acetyltransferase [Methanobacterium sp.]
MVTQKHSLSTSLSVPADMRFLKMVQGYILKMSDIAGLSNLEGQRLELAAEEAFMNILEHAYPDGNPGAVFIKTEVSETELNLSIRDEGLPFDKSLESYPEPATEIEFIEEGLGFRLIRNAVDEAHFENLGRRGKVLRLIKYLNESFKPDHGEISQMMEAAPPQQYKIRPMDPDEAIQVAQLFWVAYGYSYKNEDFYRPEGLVHLIGSGRLISYVAVAENGDVAGHVGLLKYKNVPMAEEALLVVSPVHRGRRIMDLLHDAIQAKAKEMELKGVSVDPVTSHIISQRRIIQLGGRPCSLDLAACPPRVFKGIINEKEKPQRESYLHCFNYLTPISPLVVHVPSHHEEMISKIYQNLGQQFVFENPGIGKLPGDFQINFDKSLKKGEIKVITANENQWSEILRVADDLAEFAGAEVVVLDLPLAQRASAILCELAEEEGFFFSGIRPCESFDGDYLRLQRLHVPLDLSKLNIYSQLGQELFEYVSNCRSKVL